MKELLARRGAADGAPSGASGSSGGTPAGHPHGRAVATRVAALVAVLGLVGTVVFGLLWWNSAHGSEMDTASARDGALSAARQIAVNLQTLDYRSVDKGLDTWKASSTGPLLQEFQKNGAQYAQQITAVQTTTNARLVDAALSDLDVAAGKATAIAALDVSTTKMINGTPSLPINRQVRIQLNLVRTPDAGWKAAAAGPIPS
jgi:Mce-associated membrane protein